MHPDPDQPSRVNPRVNARIHGLAGAADAAIPEDIAMDRILHQLGLILVSAVLLFSTIDSAWLHH